MVVERRSKSSHHIHARRASQVVGADGMDCARIVTVIGEAAYLGSGGRGPLGGGPGHGGN